MAILSLRIYAYRACCAVVSHIVITGVGRLRVAYPYLEAMRRPEVRDKRERDILPRLFCFHKFQIAIVDQHGEEAGQHTSCVLMSNKKKQKRDSILLILFIHIINLNFTQ